MLTLIFISSIIIFIVAYRFYGAFLSKKFDIHNKNLTPAHTENDGVDYVPTHVAMLFGHHFSSIAGAGPIVGPIIAAMYFGWLPALIWIIVGSIFVGGLHDYAAIVASLRNKGKSIGEIAKNAMGEKVFHALLLFLLICIEYVLVVFSDLTATTFASNGSVATSSVFYIFAALIFGAVLYKFKANLTKISAPFVILIFVIIVIGFFFPMPSFALFGLSAKQTWLIILLIYCFIASIMPVWALLQPRDYLSSFLLYFAVIVSFIGLLFTKNTINFPYFIAINERSSHNLTLFPVLFITVACGAVSGFHALVSSGTTAKQLSKETDAKIVGYGGMLVEGIVAIIALATIMMLSHSEAVSLSNPLVIFSHGISRFLALFGINPLFGKTAGLLIISTFLLTTLDSATRITRYLFEELFSLKGKKSRFFSTGIVLIMPLAFAFLKIKDKTTGAVLPAWNAIWPIFGATNQLLAAVTLTVVMSWMHHKYTRKSMFFIWIPTIFMYAVTLFSLVTHIIYTPILIIKITSIILITLSLFMGYVYFEKH
ncbi:MAG: carbon starvation protein A [Elusimicrobiota bacterium]